MRRVANRVGSLLAILTVSFVYPITAIEEVSAVKTWLVSPGFVSVCKVIDCGSHAKRAVTWIGFFSAVHDPSFDLYTVSVQSAPKTWLVNSRIESVSIVTDCGSRVKCVVFWNGVFFTVHVVSFNNHHTVSVLSSMKTWLVSSGIESVCIATDRGPHVTRVVSMNGSVSVAHDVSYDSHFTGLELCAVHSLMVRPVSESVYKVTDCGSHVKHVVSRDESSLAVDGVTSDSVCTAMELSVLPEQLAFGWGLHSSRCVVRPCRAGAEHIENLVGQVCESAWVSIRLSARTSDRDALSLALLKEVWQPRPHVLICSVFVLSVQVPFMMTLTMNSTLRRS